MQIQYEDEEAQSLISTYSENPYILANEKPKVLEAAKPTKE